MERMRLGRRCTREPLLAEGGVRVLGLKTDYLTQPLGLENIKAFYQGQPLDSLRIPKI